MHIYNMYEAKTKLSRLVREAIEGEEVVLAKAGKPMVKLVPYVPSEKKKLYGLMKGKIRIAEDFDSLSPAEAEMFREYLPMDDS